MACQDPRSGARYLFAAALTGGLLSQPGHLVAYLGRYGWRGLAIQGNGVHGYFPTVLGTSLAILGGLVLAALLAAAGGRLADGRRRAAGVGFGPLLMVLLLVQLNVYAVQEMLELRAAGQLLTADNLAGIAAWGAVGQLPLAVLAALALGLLSSPLLTALGALRSPFTRAFLPGFGLAEPIPVPSSAEASLGALRGVRFPAAIPRRGPPTSAC